MVNKVRVNIAGTPYAIATTDSEKYILGLAKKLDEDITKLLDTNDNLSVTKAAVFCAMDYLDEYTNFHFQAEEELQKKVSYTELAKHQEKHDEFKKSIQELYDFLNENEGPNEQFIEQVKINVVDWLFKHIKTFDRSVAEYIHLNNNAERL